MTKKEVLFLFCNTLAFFMRKREEPLLSVKSRKEIPHVRKKKEKPRFEEGKKTEVVPILLERGIYDPSRGEVEDKHRFQESKIHSSPEGCFPCQNAPRWRELGHYTTSR